MDAVRLELFWSLVDVAGPDDCWIWKGATLKRDKYGMFCGERASVIAWEEANGQDVPLGNVVRHTCDNRPCVNPRHLLIGSHADNARDRVERKRSAQNWGESSGKAAKLSDAERADIRARAARGERVQAIRLSSYPHLSYDYVHNIANPRTKRSTSGERSTAARSSRKTTVKA